MGTGFRIRSCSNIEGRRRGQRARCTRTRFRNCCSATPIASAAGQPSATRISASGRPGPGTRCSTIVRAYRGRACSRLGLKRGDDHRHRRRQPAAALLVDHGGADARRHSGAGLCRRGRRRDGLRARPCRGALRRGRRTRSRSTSCSPIADRLPKLEQHRLRRAARPARLRPHAACTRSTRSSPTAARRSPTPTPARWHRRRDRRRARARDISIILYTSGTTGRSKGVMLSAKGCIVPPPTRSPSTSLDREGRGARLSAARLGRRPLSQLRAGPWSPASA